MIRHLEHKEEFDTLTSKRCVVDFYADWCGPCKMMGKVFEELDEKIDIPIIKVNTDKYPELAQKFGVMSIPTLILMDESKEVSKHIGFMSKEEFEEFIK